MQLKRAGAGLVALLAALLLLAASLEIGAGRGATGETLSNIEVTVYYSPVESYYARDNLTYIKAWPDYSVTGAKVTEGPYPAAFVRHTKNEGTGKITSGQHRGKFLNYSFEGLGPNEDQAGFWIDTCPRDAYGGCLKAGVTAAVSTNLAKNFGMKRGVPVQLADCGSEAGNAEGCAYYKGGSWVVNDQFTTGIASDRQLDLYYGLQDRPGFKKSVYWLTMQEARIQVH